MPQTRQAGQTRHSRQKIDVPIEQRLPVRPDEAASILGLGRSTIYELMRHGELPVVHVGRAARIPTSALAHFVGHQSHETDATGPSSSSSSSSHTADSHWLPRVAISIVRYIAVLYAARSA